MLIILFRSVFIYTVLLILLRLIGKRQLGELELSELIVTILISETAAGPIIDPEAPLYSALVPTFTLIGLEYLLSVLSAKSVRLRALMSGKPSLLVVRGRIDQEQMRKNRITPDELAEAMRDQGLLDMNAVEYAVLETNGRINIIPIPEERGATAGQLDLHPADTGYPVMVVNNGRVLTDNLRLLNHDEAWLRGKLREYGLDAPEQVYMMTVDMADGVFLAPLDK